MMCISSKPEVLTCKCCFVILVEYCNLRSICCNVLFIQLPVVLGARASNK